MENTQSIKVAIVGNCTAGKTTVAAGLRSRGYQAYSVAQEHSSIKKMWSLRKPDFVLFLSCTIDAAKRRRSVYWGEEMLQKQRERLADAWEHRDLHIDTSDNTPGTTIEMAVLALRERFGGLARNGADNPGDSKEVTGD